VIIIVGVRANWARLRRRIEQSNSWPSVSGTVLRSAVTCESIDVSPEMSDNAPPQAYTPDMKDFYTVNVSYRYEVGGHTYESNRVAFYRETSLFGNEAKAKALAEQYVVGEKATVFYDPTDPKEATLIRGA
jgi:hypothetical protein